MPQQCKDAREKVAEYEKELQGVQKMIAPAVGKAKQAIALQKQEEEKQAKRVEKERIEQMARVKGQRAAEIGLYSDYLVKVLELKVY